MNTITDVLSHNIGKQVQILTVSGPYATKGVVRRVLPHMVIVETSESTCHINTHHIVNVILPK